MSGEEDRVPGQGRCTCKGEWAQGAYRRVTRAEGRKTAHPDCGELVSQVGDLGLYPENNRKPSALPVLRDGHSE